MRCVVFKKYDMFFMFFSFLCVFETAKNHDETAKNPDQTAKKKSDNFCNVFYAQSWVC